MGFMILVQLVPFTLTRTQPSVWLVESNQILDSGKRFYESRLEAYNFG
jgi:hypothetical protein